MNAYNVYRDYADGLTEAIKRGFNWMREHPVEESDLETYVVSKLLALQEERQRLMDILYEVENIQRMRELLKR